MVTPALKDIADNTLCLSYGAVLKPTYNITVNVRNMNERLNKRVTMKVHQPYNHRQSSV